MMVSSLYTNSNVFGFIAVLTLLLLYLLLDSGPDDSGLYDWDLSLKAKTDGTFGLEGLKYGSPREYEAGAGQSGGTPGLNNAEDTNRDGGVGNTNSRADKMHTEGESFGGVCACRVF